MPIGVRIVAEYRGGPWQFSEVPFLIKDADGARVAELYGGPQNRGIYRRLVRAAPELAKAAATLLDACDNLAIYEDTADRQTLSDLRECVGRARAEVRAVLDSMGVIVL